MKTFQLMFFICMLSISKCFSQVDSSFCKNLEQTELTSEMTLKILFNIEKLSFKDRYQVFEKCNIYFFAENIVKSKNLNDIQKLDYYLRIQPLFPNNAEMGSVLGYDRIKLFSEYTSQPLKNRVDSIKDKQLKSRVKAALIDADLLDE